MTITPDAPIVLPPAAYLRRRLDGSAVRGQREALRRFAARLGVPTPVFYEDRTSPGADAIRCPPQFKALVHAVLDGSHRLLLIPGPWVFSVARSAPGSRSTCCTQPAAAAFSCSPPPANRPACGG